MRRHQAHSSPSNTGAQPLTLSPPVWRKVMTTITNDNFRISPGARTITHQIPVEPWG